MSRFSWMLMLAGLLAAIGASKSPLIGRPERSRPKTYAAMPARPPKRLAEYSQQTKEEFQKKLETQLNELDAKIAKLREKGRDLKDEAKAELGSEDGRAGNETGCSPRQTGRGRSIERGGLEGRPEGSPVGLGRIGQSLPRRVARVLIDGRYGTRSQKRSHHHGWQKTW